MRPTAKGITGAIGMAGVALLALGTVCHLAGVRINTSQSIAVGIYRTTDAAIGKGMVVLACPPAGHVFALARERNYLGAGFCPGNYGYLMKRVAAMEHDTVTVADDGVRVNGALLPLSAPRGYDKFGRPLPQYRIRDYVLGRDDVLLMSDGSATGFDGRYFGPLHRSQLLTAMTVVTTW